MNSGMKTSDFNNVLRQQRKYSVILITFLLTICSIFILLWIYEKKGREEQVYVSSNVGTFEAYKVNKNTRMKHDVKNHLKFFMRNMYSYDQYTYNQKIERALKLITIDEGKKIYSDFKSNNLFDLLREKQVSINIKIDSIQVRMNQQIKAKVHCTQIINYQKIDKRNEKNLEADCSLTKTKRTTKNPFGLLINEFKIYQTNEDNS